MPERQRAQLMPLFIWTESESHSNGMSHDSFQYEQIKMLWCFVKIKPETPEKEFDDEENAVEFQQRKLHL